MDNLAQGFALHNRVDLAREADFALGPLVVRPSRCEIEAGGARRLVQRRVMQVLVALAHSTSQVVSQRELIQRCWGGLSVSDDAIGRCIGQLRRLAGAWADPPFEIETIPGVGYRLVVSTEPPGPAGAGPAAGWFSPRGVQLWIGVGGAVLAMALIGLYVTRSGGEERPIRLPAIAVLAFQPATGDPAAQSAAALLTRKVTEALSQYEVTVIASPGARASSAPGADFVVSGRLSEKQHRLSVTTDLSDPRSGIVVYSFDTPQPVGGKGDVASEIANHVALSLDPTKLSNDLGGKLTPADYTLIARANDGIDRWDMPYVLDQTRKLSARHPDDGELAASVAIGAVYAAQQAPASQQAQLLRLARRSAARAGQLSPDSGLLYIARQLLVNGPMSYATQERLLRRSLSLNPGLHVTYNGLGEMLLMVGRTDEGAELIKRSVQLDPMSGVVVGTAVLDLSKAGRAADAAQVLDRQEQVWPGDWRTTVSERYVAFFQGDPLRVEALVRSHPGPKESNAGALEGPAWLRAWIRTDPASLRRMIAACFSDLARPAQDEAPICLIQMVRLGAMDDAFRFAALAYPDHRNLYPIDADEWLTASPPLVLDPTWLFSPPMKPFRDDPRFWDVAVRTGLVDYWRSTGSWPDFCAPQLGFCRSHAAAAARARPLHAA